MGGGIQEPFCAPQEEIARQENRNDGGTFEPIDGEALALLGFGRRGHYLEGRPITLPANFGWYVEFIIGLCKVHTGGRE
jgi:hypothetical protein